LPVAQFADWIAETPESITARLSGAQAAQKQTRVTLGIMALISMMMLIASYNAYLSFDSAWALEQSRNWVPPGDPKPVSYVLTEQALKDWAASLDVTISFLGIRVSVDEAPVLGTASLAVLSLWLVLLARRENYTIGFLLRDTDSSMPSADRFSNTQRWLVFHSIMSNSFYMTFDSSLSRVETLTGPKLMTATKSERKSRVFCSTLDIASRFFFWFPAAASAAVIIVDRCAYFWPDPFEREAAISGAAAPLFWVSLVVSIGCWIPLAVGCWKSSQYSRATQLVLREYRDKLRADIVRHLPAAG
jgi:hypothetical protein